MTLIMRGQLRFAAVSVVAIVGALASARGAAADPGQGRLTANGFIAAATP